MTTQRAKEGLNDETHSTGDVLLPSASPLPPPESIRARERLGLHHLGRVHVRLEGRKGEPEILRQVECDPSFVSVGLVVRAQRTRLRVSFRRGRVGEQVVDRADRGEACRTDERVTGQT